MIFISYSFADEEKSKILYDIVNKSDKTFMASYSLNPGEKWKDEIFSNLKKADLFIVLISNESIKSQAVLHEIGAAVAVKKTIIPILLDTDIKDLPDWIKDRQAVKFDDFNEDKITGLLKKDNVDLVVSAVVTAGLLFIVKKLFDDPVKEKKKILQKKVTELISTIQDLKRAFPNKSFTIDGRLVGDIGEIIAEFDYDLVTFKKLYKNFDAVDSEGKLVQIKATFKESLTFRHNKDYYLGFKLHEDGTYKEIYNGPAKYIFNEFKNRKGIGKELLSFPIDKLEDLSNKIPKNEKIRGK